MMLKKITLIFKIFIWSLVGLNGSAIITVNAQESTFLQDKKICSSDLSTQIDTILSKPERLSENWGILIEKLDNKQILYQLNSNKYFIPASNTKLFTTASVLVKLGEYFNIKTPIYIQGLKPTIETLIIEGKGDPSLKKEQLETISKELKNQGIHSIRQLVLVDDYLPESVINYSWEFSDVFYYYAVPVNSLILEENTVTLTLNPSQISDRVLTKWSDELAGKQWLINNQGITAQKDSEYNIDLNPSLLEPKLTITGTLASNAEDDNWWLSIPQPAQYFHDVLRQSLTNNNIRVFSSQIIPYKEYKSQPYFTKKKVLLEFNSPSLKELITLTNQESNNLYAEVLFKYLALEEESLNPSESLTKVLTDLGIDSDSYQLKDGSGLSRQNLVTPTALISLLKLMNDSRYSDIFRNSLTVAGVNGTLKNRFKDTNIAHNLLGKTGSLSGVSALSGYLALENYDDLVFTIIVNQSTADTKSLRKTIDEIVLTLGKLDRC